MTTPEMMRCRKCWFLIVEPAGMWRCSANGFEIHEEPNKFDPDGECEQIAMEA